MGRIRQQTRLLIFLAVLMVAGGCSSSTESVSVAPSEEPTSTPSPIATPEPAPTAVSQPTTVPEEQNAVPTPGEQPTAAATEPAQETAETPTVEPERPVERGLLQEEFCVIDIVAPDILNVRSGPSIDDAIVDTLAEAQCRIYLTGGEANGWQEIIADLADSEIRGWVSGNFIAPQRAPIDPDAPMVVITISVEYGLDPDSPEPLDAFRLVNADGLVVGFLDANGEISVPADLDLSRARIEAAFADDPFCAWTGQLQFEGADDRYSSLLFALCA